MAEKTGIPYAHHTFSPWWGCTHVSPGCEHCFAEQVAKRRGVEWGPDAQRMEIAESTWKQPIAWRSAAARAGERRRVLCGTMCDVFERFPDVSTENNAITRAGRGRLFRLIEDTPNLDWMLFTKRPGNIERVLPIDWLKGKWPRNAWLVVSVEDQRTADMRLPIALQLPAPVHLVSYEPALSQVDFTAYLRDDLALSGVIMGCESGPQRRPMPLDWARSVRDQCQEAGAAFYLKQMEVGGRVVSLPELDGRVWDELPEVRNA